MFYDFAIYNEIISCSASEAEGSFSATYSSIIKRTNSSTNSAVLHTISKSTDTSYDDSGKKTTNIRVNGTVQGLVVTGILKTPNIIELPSNGTIFAYNNSSTNSRYSQALSGFSSIASEDDLNGAIKTALGIDNASLGISGNCVNSSLQPASHTVSHSYVEGLITYDTSYSSDNSCNPSGVTTTTVSIGVQDSVDIVAEFIIPGRAGGPIIQKIGAKTPKKITVNIEGSAPEKKCCYELQNTQYDDICAGIPLPSGVPGAEIANMKLTQDQFTFNPIDGSYSISREYIACC